jgi:galactose oxidase
MRAVAALGATLVFAVVGCSGERSDAGPSETEPLPADVDVGQDAPVDLSYVCGNRFLVTNAYGVPITVTFRVAGGNEEGVVEVPAAPPIDPAVSEAFLETRNPGTVQIFLNGKPLVARANEAAPCTPPPPAFATLITSANAGGQWSQPFNWPIVAVHMMLLPSGRVLSIGRTGSPQIWNPATGAFTASPAPARLFCAGHSLLSNGRLLLAGGHISDNHGIPNITLFSGTNVWSSGGRMARGRWYPTVTTMGNGDVVIIAGRDEGGSVVSIPEVWSNGSIRQLTGAAQTLPYYPRAFLTPNGSLYMAGAPAGTRFLSVTGSGSWRKGPTHLFGAREYGSAVMYDDGKILYAGGARTTNTAEVLDLNLASPVWRWTGSMAFARRHHNLTVLPTGEVLATGGVAGTGFNETSKGVRAAELWNPATGQWTTLASNAVTRGYHGTSLLLPDGRVLNGGSGEGAGAPDERNAEIFSPPYLFRGARPTISSAPSSLRYGSLFRVLTPQAAAIARVSFVRLGAVTHAFDQNQRFQRLSFTADATGLTVTAPRSRNRAPPGHYMLFILNSSDVPSVARIIRLY